MNEEIIVKIIEFGISIVLMGGLIWIIKMLLPPMIEDSKKRREIEITRNDILEEINKGLKDLNNGK